MIEHGTVSKYTNQGCRCKACSLANTNYQREYRVRVRSRPIPKKVHGTDNGYTNYMCRCQKCTKAHTTYAAKHREAA